MSKSLYTNAARRAQELIRVGATPEEALDQAAEEIIAPSERAARVQLEKLEAATSGLETRAGSVAKTVPPGLSPGERVQHLRARIDHLGEHIQYLRKNRPQNS